MDPQPRFLDRQPWFLDPFWLGPYSVLCSNPGKLKHLIHCPNNVLTQRTFKLQWKILLHLHNWYITQSIYPTTPLPPLVPVAQSLPWNGENVVYWTLDPDWVWRLEINHRIPDSKLLIVGYYLGLTKKIPTLVCDTGLLLDHWSW